MGMCACVITLALSLAPRPARADTQAEAKDLFLRGRALRVAGDCTSALPLFRRAHTLFPAGLGSLRNEAECEETRGRFASARRAWRDLAAALPSHSETKYEGWAQDAEQAIARLGARVATVVVDVDAVGPDGSARPRLAVVITLNGEVLDQAAIGAALERDPARYEVRVTVGEQTQERFVDVAPGETEHVRFRVVVPDAAPRAAPAAATAIDRSRAEHGVSRTIGWTALGVGGASAVAAGVALLVRQAALDDFYAKCPKDRCSPTADSATIESIHSRGVTATTLANVFGAVGLVGLVAGGVVLATDAARPARAALVVAPNGAWLEGAF
jgi:hypothetical protein